MPSSQKGRRNHMATADRYFSVYVRNRDQTCIAPPPHKGVLQCAHIHSRSYKSIRTDPDNAVALCASHHKYFTHRRLEWQEFIESRFPGRWDELKRKALRYERVDWQAESKHWKEQV